MLAVGGRASFLAQGPFLGLLERPHIWAAASLEHHLREGGEEAMCLPHPSLGNPTLLPPQYPVGHGLALLGVEGEDLGVDTRR